MRSLLTLIALFILLFSTGCSFRTVVHPYPYQYSGNPEEAVDKLELIRQNGYFYVEPDSGKKVSLNYSNGALHVNTGFFKAPSFSKNDAYTNPITLREYALSASAKFNADYDADEFTLNVTEVGSDSVLGFVEGLVEDATVFFNESSFRFTALEVWGPKVQKEKADGETVWNHYPFGGSWSLQVNNVMVGEIVQGSPVVQRFGAKSHYGESFTFLFIKEISTSLEAELINAWMAYLALTDIEYYYYECNYDYPANDGSCPGSVIVK
ncbi:MAG: hypothetical protein JJ971_14825 [Balneolaceae bacterium]|nr:hypothetical protein [Balneolaceae bacterium]MBO6547672.1 hypothetical protein [Balneolaceae bacterium]MBO6648183.1 hypothetical protein [Balneolaceae bacterium]